MAGEPVPAERPGVSRRTIAIVFGVLCAGLVAGYFLFLRTDYAVVYSGLRPTDAAAIVAQLDAKGVPHRLRDDGTTILVPADQADGVRLAVAGSDVPLKGAVGFELFNKSDMGLTDFAQKINYQRALQGELTRSITMMEGVETARVHLAIPERSLFRAERSTPKAAVEVIPKLGFVLGTDRVQGVQQLVASAVPELDAANVTVLDGDGRVVSQGAPATDAGSPELSEQAAAQAYFEARAKAALAASLPGVRFAVHVLAGTSTTVLTSDATAEAEEAEKASSASAARSFPLRVTIVSAAPLNGEDQGIARDVVANAVGLQNSLGDALAFQVGPTDPLPAPPALAPVATATTLPSSAASSAEPSGPARPFAWWFVLAGVALLAAVALASSRGGGLPVDEQEDFAARLRAQLEREGPDARA